MGLKSSSSSNVVSALAGWTAAWDVGVTESAGTGGTWAIIAAGWWNDLSWSVGDFVDIVLEATWSNDGSETEGRWREEAWSIWKWSSK